MAGFASIMAEIASRQAHSAKYTVAVDFGTSGTAFAYHARPSGGVTGLRSIDTRLNVYAPGRRMQENAGKAPSAVCLDAEEPRLLHGIGSDAFEEWKRAEEEGLAHT